MSKRSYPLTLSASLELTYKASLHVDDASVNGFTISDGKLLDGSDTKLTWSSLKDCTDALLQLSSEALLIRERKIATGIPFEMDCILLKANFQLFWCLNQNNFHIGKYNDMCRREPLLSDFQAKNVEEFEVSGNERIAMGMVC